MKDWTEIQIKELGRVVTGKTPPTSDRSFFDGSYRFVSPKDMDFDSRYIRNTLTTITQKAIEKFKNQVLPIDSIMFTSLSYGFGKIGITDTTSLTNQQINSIIVDEKNHDFNFVYYLLRHYKDRIFSYNAGIVTPIVPKSVFEKIKVFVPSNKKSEVKIASILSAYDDLIENNLKRIKLLEEKAFVTYKGIVSSEEMEEFTIDELANVVMGQSPTSNTYTDEKDNLPFHQGVTNFSNYFVVHKIYCKAPIKIAEEGDILFSVRAPVGRINFTTERICIGRGLCAFRSKKGFQNYFYHQLKDFFFEEDVIGNGAIFNAVTKAELMKVKLKTPSEKIQKEFEIESKQIYDLILNLTKQNTKLREARDILLPRLMNGQIEV